MSLTEDIDTTTFNENDSKTDVSNYFFIFEYLEQYKDMFNRIKANYFHIINNTGLSGDELEKLNVLIEKTKDTYNSFRKKESVLTTEEAAKKYELHLANILKLTEEMAG